MCVRCVHALSRMCVSVCGQHLERVAYSTAMAHRRSVQRRGERLQRPASSGAAAQGTPQSTHARFALSVGMCDKRGEDCQTKLQYVATPSMPRCTTVTPRRAPACRKRPTRDGTTRSVALPPSNQPRRGNRRTQKACAEAAGRCETTSKRRHARVGNGGGRVPRMSVTAAASWAAACCSSAWLSCARGPTPNRVGQRVSLERNTAVQQYTKDGPPILV